MQYLYVKANAVNWIDPLGEVTITSAETGQRKNVQTVSGDTLKSLSTPYAIHAGEQYVSLPLITLYADALSSDSISTNGRNIIVNGRAKAVASAFAYEGHYFAKLSCVENALSGTGLAFSNRTSHVFNPNYYTWQRGYARANSVAQDLIATGSHELHSIRDYLAYERQTVIYYKNETYANKLFIEAKKDIEAYKYDINEISLALGWKSSAVEAILFGEVSLPYGPMVTGEAAGNADIIGALTDIPHNLYNTYVQRERAENSARAYLSVANSDMRYYMYTGVAGDYFTGDLLKKQSQERNSLGDYGVFVPEYLSGYESRISEIAKINSNPKNVNRYKPTDQEIQEFIDTF